MATTDYRQHDLDAEDVTCEVLPLTAAQRGMWFAEKLSPDYSVNIAQYVDIRHAPGGLDIELLERCCVDVGRIVEFPFVRLTEIDGVPMQYVDLDFDQHVDILDFRDVEDPVGTAMAWMQAEYRTPVDLITDQLIVIAIIRVGDDRTFWYNRAHHIIIDGYAALSIMRRTVDRYNALRRGELPTDKTPAAMSEIVDYEDAYQSGTRRVADREHWLARAADLPERVTLAQQSAAAPLSFDNVVAGAELPPRLQRRLEALAGELNSSIAVLLTAGFGAFLSRMTGTDDIVMSLPVTGRSTAKIKASGGMVSNVLPIRLRDVSSQSPLGLIRSAQLELTGALRHQRYRSDDIRRDAGFDAGSVSFGPTINMVFFDDAVAIDGTTMEYRILTSGILEDLLINLYQSSPGAPLVVDLHGNPNLYSAGQMADHHRRFLVFVERLISEAQTPIRDIDLLIDGEADEIGVLEAGTSLSTDPGPSDNGLILDRFAAQVRATPDRVAIVDGDRQWTYTEVDRLRRDLSVRLAGHGVRPGDRVAVIVPRGIEQVTTVYAVLTLGAAFVPIDPDQPRARRDLVLATASPRCIVDPEFLAATGFSPERSGLAELAVPVTVPADAAAYVMFTSGSTGTPKGVQVSHRAVRNRLDWGQDHFGLSSTDVILYKTPITFDVSVPELFWPLQVGARMVIARPGGHRDPIYLRDIMIAHGVTTVHFVPSMLSVFTDAWGDSGEPIFPASVRRLFASGEGLPAPLAARVLAGADAAVINLYGPTEAAVEVTEHVVSPGESTIPIGSPAPNCQLHVLDSRLQRVPIGVPGELYLAGPQLADGYVGAGGLSAERFVAHAFGVGERMYRTGDLVRWTTEGTLEYLGRSDFQIKIRGQRVELAEIETTLLADDAVDAAVAVVTEVGGAVAVAAYVKVRRAEHEDDDTLENRVLLACRKVLPSHMVPSSVTVLDEFPVNASGKLDRKALPAPVIRSATGTAYEAPTTPTGKVIVGVIEEILGGQRIGLADNIFALGADSLTAARLASRLRAGAGLDISLSDIFESRTVGELATAARPIGSTGPATGDRPDLTGVPRPERIPLSYPQARLWFINRLDPTSGTYNIPGAVRLGADLDESALGAVIGDLVTRHESLRTTFPDVDGEPEQRIHEVDEAVAGTSLEVVEVEPVAVDGRIADLARAGFDLARQYPVRATLLRVRDADTVVDHVLLIVIHHIVGDGASLTPLITDVMTAYAARVHGNPPAWQPLPVQYADYTLWQREMLGDDHDEDSVLGRQIAFWRRELDGMPHLLNLPTDRPHPSVPSGAGGIVDLWLDDTTVAGLRAVAARHGVTLFAVFHSALAVVLSRLADSDDIAIGTAISGRDDPKLAGVIGMFVNTVVLRTHVDESDSVAALLTSAHRVRSRAMSNGDAPFEQVVSALGATRSRAHTPLFGVELVMQHDHVAHVLGADPRFDVLDARVRSAKYDLSTSIVEYGDSGPHANRISIEFCYATDLFDRPTIDRFARFMRAVLDSIVESGNDPARSPRVEELLHFSDTEVDAVRNFSVGPSAHVPTQTPTDAFAAQMHAAPDAPALIMGERTVTYAEFGARVAALAEVLRRGGVGPETAVGVCIPRSVEMMVAIHAVLAAGAQYVPLDTAAPPDRIRDMIVTSGLRTLLLAVDAPDHREPDCPLTVLRVDASSEVASGAVDPSALTGIAGVHPDDAAYTLFTSGSTGRPKGVVVSHAAIANRLAWMQAHYPLTAHDVVLQKTPITFDVSVWELLWPLMVGASVVIAEPGRHGDPEYIAEVIGDRRVSVLHFVPSMLATFTDVIGAARLEELSTLRMMFTSGEALTVTTAQRVVTALPAIGLHNLYGPTEAAVDVTEHRVLTDEPSVPIGRPVWNTETYVLDSRLRLVPAGVPGELYIGGVQLARGYASRGALTAERFVANPFGGGGDRLYRTGDLVKWSNDGELEYLGRNDFQVKLRGQRLELGEVEAVVASAPGVVHVAATVVEMAGGDQLVAYVAPDTVDLDVVKTVVAQHLPDYMRPTIWMPLAAMPLSTAGKVDRKALPSATVVSTGYVAPSTSAERAAAQVFADVLGLDQVGAADSFFDIGGNSLTATKVAARLSAVLDRHIPVAAIFDAPSVAEICAYAAHADGSRRRPPIAARAHGDTGPLSSVQRGMWLVNRADPDSPVYNVAMALRLVGALDRDALRRAFEDVIVRHESLRTTYPMVDGEPTQVVLSRDDALLQIERRYIEIGDDLDETITSVVGRGFDVTRQPPVRLAVLGISPTEHILVLVVHHIAADGSSMAPLARDVMATYGARISGKPSDLRPLNVQYLDFALWQQDWLFTPGIDGVTEHRRQLDYWVDRLAGAPPRLEIPTDRPHPRTPSFAGGEVRFGVRADVVDALDAIARENNATLFMVMHAAFAVLLGRLSASADVVIGTPFGGRGDEALDDVVGMFVNTLALRTSLRDEEKFSELLQRVRDHDLADMANADIAFDAISAAVVSTPPSSYNPIYQAMFAFQNFDFPSLELPELTIEPVSEQLTSAKVDLQLTLFPGDAHTGSDGAGITDTAAMRGQLIYATDVYDQATIESFAQRYLRVLDDIAAEPQLLVGDISIATDTETAAAEQGPEVMMSLPEMVAAAAAARPESTAVELDGASVTFATLGAMTAAMAVALPDADSALTTALMSVLPAIAAAGPEGLGAALAVLRGNARAAAGDGWPDLIEEGTNST